MKKIYQLAFVIGFVSASLQVKAQTGGSAFNEQGKQQLDNSISADSKKNFWDFVAYAGSIMSNTANGISFNPTLDKLGLKGGFSKATQFNFTPVTKGTDITRFDSLNIGFTFAIINNFSKARWQREVDNNPDVQRYLALQNELVLMATSPGYMHSSAKFQLANAGRVFSAQEWDMVKAFQAKVAAGKVTVFDIKYVPAEYKYGLLIVLASTPGEIPATNKTLVTSFISNSRGRTSYALSNGNTVPALINSTDENMLNTILTAEFNQVYTAISDLTTNFVKKQPQLNAGGSLIQNFVSDRLQGYYFSADYTRYFGRGAHFSYSVKTAYSFEDDTLARHFNFDRQISKNSVSVNWLSPFWNPNYNSISPVELKLAIECNVITAGHINEIEKEKKWTWKESLGLTFNVSDKVAIPLTIKYDHAKSNFLGFLSVQYNLGG